MVGRVKVRNKSEDKLNNLKYSSLFAFGESHEAALL